MKKIVQINLNAGAMRDKNIDKTSAHPIKYKTETNLSKQ